MSDYLGRLAARVVAPQRVLRPRVHTAFESYESIETFAPEAPIAAPRPRASMLPGVPAPTRTMHIEPPSPLPEPLRTGAEHREIAPSSTVERIRDVVRERTQIEVADTPAPLIVERDAAPVPAAPPAMPRERVETQTLVRERRMLERIERLRVRSERSEGLRTEHVNSPIEITIGRIDVRAVVSNAAPPPPRQREQPPLMSLRDYLARRDERRRG